MALYEDEALKALAGWKNRMKRKPSYSGELVARLQLKINNALPEKFHRMITTAIKQMTRAVSFGAEYTNPEPLRAGSLQERERKVMERIKFYSRTAAAEGALTGAGGIVMGFADFPLWLALKMKMLFEIASLYGFEVNGYKERIYLLYIFELTFSTQLHRNSIFSVIEDWENYAKQLPGDIHAFNWRKFQQEYRDYIDVAKLLQLIPGIGAAVGAYVNLRLTHRLGDTAMNAYRMRWIALNKIAGYSGEHPAVVRKGHGAVE